ncbi:hypothetical protein ACLOJK_009191 [Asimina triloba]
MSQSFWDERPSSAAAAPLTLSTNSRWVVDESGKRAKLACVSWPAHMEAMVPEGLSMQPLDNISKNITAMGFNCVRLTWALYMLTDDSLGSTTVHQSFQNLGLNDALAGIQTNNPQLLKLTVVQAFQAVVSNLASNNIMIIIDNHISKPGWCCSRTDDNGFFGDKDFDPDTWVNGLTKMATMFKGAPNVVGMSLRNEPRGLRENPIDWYTYMQKAAEAVHAASPDFLVILSGLNFDTDLSFLAKKPMEVTFQGKLVYEMHWYSFSNPTDWESLSTNQACANVTNTFITNGVFLLEKGWPVFFSEFGMDLRGTNENDNKYISCYLGAAAEHDWDWAVWALQGSYYLRDGLQAPEEVYGVLSKDWSSPRNQAFLDRLSALQSPFQGPEISNVNPYQVIFHPLSGLCVWGDPLKLGRCSSPVAWRYTPQKTLVLDSANLCLQAQGNGQAAKLGALRNDSNAIWELTSDSKMHLSTKLADGSMVCLDADASNNIVTNPCKCLDGDRACDPTTQWFKIVDSSRQR